MIRVGCRCAQIFLGARRAIEHRVQRDGGDGGQQNAAFDQGMQIMRHPLFEIRRDQRNHPEAQG